MKRTTVVGLVILPVLASIGLAGCAGDPCASVPRPSKEAVDLVRQGYEVERTGQGGAECELTSDGAWVADVD